METIQETSFEVSGTLETSPLNNEAVTENVVIVQLENDKKIPVKDSGIIKCKKWARSLSKKLTMVVTDDCGGNEEEVTLMYSQHERLPMKDFNSEVRAALDVERFINQAILLLDITANSLEDILGLLLNKILIDEQEMNQEEVKNILFTQDSVHILAKTIQGTSSSQGEMGFDYDQSWICALCSLPNVQRRHVAIARMKHAANLGRTSQEIYFIILVVTPTKEKSTKSAVEMGRTFSTLFADIDFRHTLLEAKTEEEFIAYLQQHAKNLAEEQAKPHRKSLRVSNTLSFQKCDDLENQKEKRCFQFAKGIRGDIKRRLPHYASDFKDGITGHKTLQKLASTTLFLYFACLLPDIAFGVLNSKNTHGIIDIKKVIFSQTVGGLFFHLFGGQPLVVLLTTAPLALYTKIIYNITEDFNLNFLAFYGCVGLWNTFFLVIYSLFDVSKLMKWSTRSTEEIFALFISIAFSLDAFKDLAKDFQINYFSATCNPSASSTIGDPIAGNLSENISMLLKEGAEEVCYRENTLLYIILMFGTLWLGATLYNFTKSPYLDASKREILTDYALPIAVIIFSFIGSYCFRDIKLSKFTYDAEVSLLIVVPFKSLSIGAVFGAMGLGFCLSLLFFMDQNISSAMVNTPVNKLKKGTAYHLDLMVVAIINAFLSVFGLPWVHAALPHSPLHVKALADTEERVDQGHIHNIIVHVRETRLTGIISHVMIGLSIFLLPVPLQYIPQPVLYGLFLYVAITALDDNQMFERIMLLVTEQSSYPPNHYVRRVPQRKIHIFTAVQLMQLIILCGFGFASLAYLKMVFPVLIALLLPVRHKLVPKIIEKKYLEALDRAI